MNINNDETLTEVNDGLKLIQKQDGLTFGTDAYLLAAYVRRQTRARAADLGSGTGIMPLLLLSRKKVAHVHAVELQSDFADIIGRNAELNGFDGLLTPHLADVRDIKTEDFGGTVDVVLSNPPYMKVTGKANESERKNIARHEVAGGITDFCNAAGRILKHGGLFYTVWRPDRLCELMDALAGAGLEVKRMTFVHSRVDLPPCLVLCEAKKGAASGVYVTPPLVMYSSGTVYTDTLTKIYETGDFDESYQKP
ncbi:MAG: methyltransferase [Clostridia bacterium]|nr:methyltransferase [Clostridia bacterium]